MKFRTELLTPPYPFQIRHEQRIMLLGSCFSDHIGQFLLRGGFMVLSNPFGTLFNPLSISNSLRMSMVPERFSENYIYHHHDLWISFAHHSKFSNVSLEVMRAKIEEELKRSRQFLREADYLFAANCHKIPASEFEKRRATVQEIVTDYQLLFEELKEFNPKIKIIFTVSPIRHLGDGFHENQLSKSTLHLVTEELTTHENRYYFPAYELLLDDLRDYRFFAHDLCHPSVSAIEYISEKFMEAFFSPETKAVRLQKEREFKAKEHIPIVK